MYDVCTLCVEDVFSSIPRLSTERDRVSPFHLLYLSIHLLIILDRLDYASTEPSNTSTPRNERMVLGLALGGSVSLTLPTLPWSPWLLPGRPTPIRPVSESLVLSCWENKWRMEGGVKLTWLVALILLWRTFPFLLVVACSRLLSFFQSCVTGVYCQHSTSQVVQTAWAVLCFVSAKYPDRAPIDRALKLIMDRQLDDGSWAQEDIEGIFVRIFVGGYIELAAF